MFVHFDTPGNRGNGADSGCERGALHRVAERVAIDVVPPPNRVGSGLTGDDVNCERDEEVVLPVSSCINDFHSSRGVGGVQPTGSNIRSVALTLIAPPSARDRDKVDAVRCPAVGNPSKGARVMGPERGRDAEAQLELGAVKNGAIRVLGLGKTAPAHTETEVAEPSRPLASTRRTTSG